MLKFVRIYAVYSDIFRNFYIEITKKLCYNFLAEIIIMSFILLKAL
jgi:hypothetical protein